MSNRSNWGWTDANGRWVYTQQSVVTGVQVNGGTRAEIRANIAEAQVFAASIHKPVFNSEIACIGHSNPYDLAIEEFNCGHMGWYLWELTITHEWSDVHGVFYPDGTVRDPSIVAAVMGFYRNCGPSVALENPDRERGGGDLPAGFSLQLTGRFL